MPNDERILETMPTGTLGLIPTASQKGNRYCTLNRTVSDGMDLWKRPEYPFI